MDAWRDSRDIGFDLIVSNRGPDSASHVSIVDLLPDVHASWKVTANAGAACRIEDRQLSCDVGLVGLDTTRRYSLTAPGATCRSVANAAEVRSSTHDPTMADHVAHAQVPDICNAPPADVGVRESAWAHDGRVTFTFHVLADGPTFSKDVVLVDALPSVGNGWHLDGSDARDCKIEASFLQCTFGVLEPLSGRALSVWTDAPSAGEVRNTATLHSEVDLLQSNNHDAVVVHA